MSEGQALRPYFYLEAPLQWVYYLTTLEGSLLTLSRCVWLRPPTMVGGTKAGLLCRLFRPARWPEILLPQAQRQGHVSGGGFHQLGNG